MKHSYFKTILLCLCMFASINAFAEAVEIDGIYYNLVTKAKQAEVTKNPNKYSGTVKIPETISYNDVTYSVTSIGGFAFSYCSGLTVTIPNSVTSIGECAFEGCSGLTSITIPNSVTSIGWHAFSSCFGLEKVIVPDIAAWCGIAFADSESNPLYYAEHLYSDETTEITNLIIPNSVTSIGECAFFGCSALTSVTIPNSVTSIGEDAFSSCFGLTSVTIPNSVTSIESSVFYNCSGLTSVTIPNSVTSIGSRAFEYCSGLTSITIPNSVTSIGGFAFTYCSGLTSVTIGNSVKSIGGCAFAGCSGLKKVIVPDIAAWCGISFVDSHANPLDYAQHLYSDETTEITNLIIPNSVTSIENYAFKYCSGLISVTIPNSVTSIGTAAFSGCSGLTSITIPNSVKNIGGSAFLGCSGLTSVTIPNSVTSIGTAAFDSCSGLTSVTIPNSVTSIGTHAFSSCSGLTSVNIGNGVKSIGSYAFSNCAELTDVYCYAEIVPSTESDAFADSYTEYATLHVRAVSLEQYRARVPWSNFGTIVTTDDPLEKCATPTISYSKGELTFSCDTEGAEFVSKITDADIKDYFTSSISLSVTYNISVYATKAGYENSDTIQATLCWIEQQPQTEGITDEDAIAEVQAVPVLIQTQGNTINVEGAEAGTEIILYGANGVQLDSVIATTGIASLSTSRLSGSVAIVKIGNKTVKVLIKQ